MARSGADARARDILADAYPGREIVTVDARELFARGGGIHCITQQQPSAQNAGMTILEASIADLRSALESGATTAEALVNGCLDRIAHYDRAGPRLNAVPVLNPGALAEARASDARRAAGRPLSPLDGIPYTAKDSYKVAGLTVACGSSGLRRIWWPATTPSPSRGSGRRRDPDRAHQHAADGERRDAARPLRARRSRPTTPAT